MSTALVTIAAVGGFGVGWLACAVLTIAARADRDVPAPSQLGDPRAMDAVILARLSGPTPPPRPRPAPPTEVLTRPIDLGRVSNDDARDLFPAVCGPDGKCARHVPALCLRSDSCCATCPA